MRRLIAPLVVTLFALFAAQPLFIPQLTCSDDSAFHIYRAVALEQLIDSGHVFGRWSPHMAQGFGYPFFNYYGPLSTYLLVTLHKLGLAYPAAFHLFLGLCLWLAGLALYAFVREWWGEAAGAAAAVCYLTAPYFGYDILFRGVLAETFALVWPPVLLLTLHRALRGEAAGAQRVRDGLLAALAFAALLYTHNTTALIAAPLAAGYAAFLAFERRDWRVLLHGALLLGLGLALAARFWVPALAEQGLVQSDRLLVRPIFTYDTNFISPGELLAPPAPIDPLLINPSPPRAVGLLTALLALLGLAALVLRRPLPGEGAVNGASRDVHFGLWLLGCGALLGLFSLPVSGPAWEALPLLPFVQFPWRFVGPAALCASALAGACVRWMPARQWAIAGAIVSLAALGSLAWWSPRYCASFDERGLADLIQYERDTSTLGTTAKGEFLPRTVRLLPEDTAVADALIRGEAPQYLTGLPGGARPRVVVSDPLAYRAEVTLAEPARLTFNQFYFPGWRAFVDEQPVPIRLAPDTGLITIPVPSGQHTVRFYFGSTPVRTAGELISSLAALAVLGVGMAGLRAARTQAEAARARDSRPGALPAAFLLIPIALLLARPLLIDRIPNPLRRSAFDGSALHLGSPVSAPLAGGLTLLSAEVPESVRSGAEFDVRLYLTARERVPLAYRPRFDLISIGGLVWNSGNDALPPRWHREPPETLQWPPGQYAQWARRERVLPGTPPGDYALTVITFDRATLAPDSVLDENGNRVSPVTTLGTVRVTRPESPPDPAGLGIQHPADHDFGPIRLLGYNLDRAEARPGDTVLITLFLRADDRMPADHRLTLVDFSYPTSAWQPGDVWRFQTLARIPVSAPSGPFRFEIAPITFSGPGLALQPIHLTAPERHFTPPPIAVPAAFRFGEAIELAGYESQSSNGQLRITLLWHALAETAADLSAFVHLEDASGRIVAQSDAVPAGWARPTTGWAPGEFILDTHTLPALPPGDYTLYVGLADRLSGVRLRTDNGDRAGLGVYKAP